MRLLLDSHALIWYLQDDAKLPESARVQIDDPENEAWVSAVSAWEIAIKVKLRKLALPIPFEEMFPAKIQELVFKFLDIHVNHIRDTLSLPLHHADPFDRLLIAQVRVEGMSFVSCDLHAAAYGVSLIW